MNTQITDAIVLLLAQLRKEFPALTNEEYMEAIQDGVDEYDLHTSSLEIEECLN
jgi:hypothetical protein